MNSLTKKIFVGVMALALAFTFTVSVGAEENGIMDKIDELDSRFEAIMELLGGAPATDGTTTTTTTTTTTVSVTGVPGTFTFTQNLKQGARGMDVKYLQILLNADTDTRVSVAGAGSPGMETEYFGPATLAAVKKFQTKYASEVLAPVGLTTATGFVGAQTRAKLNALLAGGVVGTPGATTPDKLAEILEMLQELADEVKALRDKVTDIDPRTPSGDEGEMKVTASADVYGETLKPNAKGLEVAKFELEAKKSDLTVQRIDVAFFEATLTRDGLRTILDKVYLYVDEEKVGEATLTRDNVRTGTADNTFYVRFTGLDIEIAKDGKESVSVVVDAKNFADDITPITVTFENDAIRSIDGAGLYQYNADNPTRNFTVALGKLATIESSVSDDTPEKGVVFVKENTVLTNDVTLAKFDVEVEDGDAQLTSALVQIDTTTADLNKVVARVKLYVDGVFQEEKTVSVGGGVKTEVFTFEIDYVAVDKDETVEIEVVADIYGMNGVANFTQAEVVLARLNTVNGLDADENVITDATVRTGETQHLYTAAPSFKFLDGTYSYVHKDNDNHVMAVLEFEMTAVEKDIYVKQTPLFAMTGNTSFGLFAGLVNPAGAKDILLSATGNLVDQLNLHVVTDVVGVDFTAVGGDYDTLISGNYRVKAGKTAKFEIALNFGPLVPVAPANLNVAPLQRISLDGIVWDLTDVAPTLGADQDFFDVTPQTVRLSR